MGESISKRHRVGNTFRNSEAGGVPPRNLLVGATVAAVITLFAALLSPATAAAPSAASGLETVAGAPTTVSEDNDQSVDAQWTREYSRDAADAGQTLTNVEFAFWMRPLDASCAGNILIEINNGELLRPFDDCGSANQVRTFSTAAPDLAPGENWTLALTDVFDQNPGTEFQLNHLRISYTNANGVARSIDHGADVALDATAVTTITLDRDQQHLQSNLTNVTLKLWTRNSGSSCHNDVALFINGVVHQPHPGSAVCVDDGPLQATEIPLSDVSPSTGGDDWVVSFVDSFDQNSGEEYQVKWLGITYEADSLPPPSPQFSTFIGVGESYAAGQGALDPDVAQEGSVQVCHMPYSANTEVLPITRLAWDFGTTATVTACGGSQLYAEAPATEVSISGPDIGYQLNQLVEDGLLDPAGDNSHVLVTMSSGGNYLRTPDGLSWPSLLTQCILPGPSCSNLPTAAEFTDMGDALDRVYDDIFATGPGLTLVHMGYPKLLGGDGVNPCVQPWSAGTGDFSFAFDVDETIAIDAGNVQLNNELRSRAESYSPANGEVMFIDLMAGPNPLDQGACSGVHITPLTFTGSTLATDSFHPTPEAYRLEYERLADALGLQAQYSPPPPPPSCSDVGALLDPFGARLAPAVALRLPEHELLSDGESETRLAVDVHAEPGSTVTVSVLEDGAVTDSTTLTSGECYSNARGDNRWFVKNVILQLAPGVRHSVVLAEVKDAAGNVIATDASTITRAAVVEDAHTMTSMGFRINSEALSTVEDAIEPLLEATLGEELKKIDLGGEYDVEYSGGALDNVDLNTVQLDVDVSINPTPAGPADNGGLQLSIIVNDFTIGVGGLGEGGLDCYFLAEPRNDDPIYDRGVPRPHRRSRSRRIVRDHGRLGSRRSGTQIQPGTRFADPVRRGSVAFALC